MNGHLPAPIAAALASSPLVMCDVGARGGPPRRWRPVFEHMVWIAFEPDARSRDALDPSLLPRRHVILPTALWNRRARIPFYLTRDGGDSSVLRPNAPFIKQFARPERFDVVAVSDVDVSPLDEAFAEHGITGIDFLKLDTQGSERQILEGATHTLRTGLIGIEVEVEFNHIYEAQPLFADLDPLIRSNDLELVDLVPKRWIYAAGQSCALARGKVVWGEALYLRPVDAFCRDLGQLDSPVERMVPTAKAVAIGLIHGIPDYSAAIVAACAPLLTPADAEALRAAIREWDATGHAEGIPFQLDLKPDEVRALRHIEARTGTKATAQVRRAIREWIRRASEDDPSGLAGR